MQIKRILAKEGLILLVLIILGFTLYFSARHLNNIFLAQHQAAKFKVIHNMRYTLSGYSPYLWTMSFGLNFALFSYPFLALLRFILWAFRTLNKK